MRRRKFITCIGVVAAWPLVAGAQQTGKLPTIGFLGAATAFSQTQWTAAFVQHCANWAGSRAARSAIEYRWAEGSSARAAAAGAEFVSRKVDVILTNGTAVTIAVKGATSTIPIVFAAAGDPVGTGLVANLARPDGNVTGLSVQATDLAGKHVELLREIWPGLRRLALLVNIDAPNAVLQMREMQVAAGTLGLDVNVVEIRQPEDIEPAFATLKDRVDALFVANEPLTVSNRVRINALAVTARLPTMFAFREFVEAGGLMSYGPNFPDMFRRAGDYVDKILRGTKPGELPVEQPIKFDLVINLKTATALGLTVPATLLARADEVIE